MLTLLTNNFRTDVTKVTSLPNFRTDVPAERLYRTYYPIIPNS
jgi:hypothetical protein